MKGNMKKLILISFIIPICLMLLGCALQKPTVVINEDINNFSYVYITPTQTLSSGTAGTYYNGYSNQYYSVDKSINPNDVISGFFSKNGFIKIPELKEELLDKTLIINYGESGRRDVGFGYAIEVTIQLVSAKSNTLISSCTAEGMGETEADDIRIAINRCLSGIFNIQP